MSSASLVADDDEPPTLTRPRTSVPSIVKKRRVSFSIELRVGAVRGDLAVAVEQHVPRAPSTWSKVSRPLSTPGRPAFGPSSPMVTPGIGVPSLVADRHQPGVHAVVLALGDQLGEDDRHPAVLGRVADVVLAGGLVRGVQVEASAVVGVVGAGRPQLLDVGAVAGLGHREAAGQVEAHDVAQVRLVVALGAQQLDGAAEQAPLDAGLDHQRQVAEGQHLDRGRPSRRSRPHRRTPSGSRGRRGRCRPASSPRGCTRSRASCMVSP